MIVLIRFAQIHAKFQIKVVNKLENFWKHNYHYFDYEVLTYKRILSKNVEVNKDNSIVLPHK